LTVARSPRYKAAFAAVLLAVPVLALADKVAGAIVPDDATKVAENRYRVPRSYDETLRFYKQIYGPGRYARKPIADQPGLKAVHIENPDARPGTWEGLNVYELKGETRVFVLVRPREERAKPQR
jgi:hypothetical protein